MKKLANVILWSILCGVMALIFLVSAIGGYLCINKFSAAINMALGTSDFETIHDGNAEPATLFESDYDSVNGSVLYDEDSKMIEEAESEGAVLLWNKDEALPLANGNKLSLFGRGSREFVLSGSGSGYVNSTNQQNVSVTVDLKTALESRSFSVNDQLWNALSSASNKPTRPDGACTEWQQWFVNEFNWSTYSAVSGSFSSFNDAAIVTITRTGGEYSDLHYNYTSASATGSIESTPAEGGYLGLTDQEEAIFQNLRNLHFGKVIVLLNTGNPLQMQDLEKYYDMIDACMWIGQVGSTGANAVADLLAGNIAPSGRLVDTYAYDLNSAPSTVNDGSYVYANANLVSGLVSASKCAANRYNTYMVYQEGIYVGYKYYETRYYDSIVNDSYNASSTKGAKHSDGAWDYDSEVAFPFGYGLSYTTFEYSNFDVKTVGDHYEVSVTVKNTGNVKGKEVVQVYLQKPYTQYDIDNQVEKSAIELIGFEKTKTLDPGALETVTVSVKKEDFKTYDANRYQTYIVEKGDYYLTVGTDSHVAVNNVISAQNKNATVSQNVLGGNVKESVLGDKFVERISLNDDFTTYSKSTQTGVEITNRLDRGDINKYDGRGSNEVTYLSRSDWDATYPAVPQLTLNETMANDLKDASTNRSEMLALLESGEANNYYPQFEYTDLPSYGILVSGETDPKKIPNVGEGDLSAFMFIEAPYDPVREDDGTVINGKTFVRYWTEMWDQLLDQMTLDEQAFMCANAYHQLGGAPNIALPASKQENGPVGITKRGDFGLPNDEIKDWSWVAYPCNPVLASTFNKELIEKVGQHMSEDMLYLGYNGIYGPGVNMHRTPFGGRNFEYPSEDSYLAGEVGYAVSKGIESKGSMAYAKHFALNDTETNRRHVQIWSNEQATREIYLKPFERTFNEGGASATMNSFTRVGTRWSGACYEMMTLILRNEWGWDGINISDWQQANPGPMNYLDGILAGTDSFDGNGSAASLNVYKDYPAVAYSIRTSAKRIVYNVVRTNAMNGSSISSRTIPHTPWWHTAFNALTITFGVLTAICAGMIVFSIVFKKKSR